MTDFFDALGRRAERRELELLGKASKENEAERQIELAYRACIGGGKSREAVADLKIAQAMGKASASLWTPRKPCGSARNTTSTMKRNCGHVCEMTSPLLIPARAHFRRAAAEREPEPESPFEAYGSDENLYRAKPRNIGDGSDDVFEWSEDGYLAQEGQGMSTKTKPHVSQAELSEQKPAGRVDAGSAFAVERGDCGLDGKTARTAAESESAFWLAKLPNRHPRRYIQRTRTTC